MVCLFMEKIGARKESLLFSSKRRYLLEFDNPIRAYGWKLVAGDWI